MTSRWRSSSSCWSSPRLSVLLSEKYIQQKGINYGEYYALLLFSTSGAMLMAT